MSNTSSITQTVESCKKIIEKVKTEGNGAKVLFSILTLATIALTSSIQDYRRRYSGEKRGYDVVLGILWAITILFFISCLILGFSENKPKYFWVIVILCVLFTLTLIFVVELLLSKSEYNIDSDSVNKLVKISYALNILMCGILIGIVL